MNRREFFKLGTQATLLGTVAWANWHAVATADVPTSKSLTPAVLGNATAAQRGGDWLGQPGLQPGAL